MVTITALNQTTHFLGQGCCPKAREARSTSWPQDWVSDVQKDTAWKRPLRLRQGSPKTGLCPSSQGSWRTELYPPHRWGTLRQGPILGCPRQGTGPLSPPSPARYKGPWSILPFPVLFLFLKAAPAAHGSSQTRSQIGAAAAGLCYSHSNSRSKLHMGPTPQLMALPEP